MVTKKLKSTMLNKKSKKKHLSRKEKLNNTTEMIGTIKTIEVREAKTPDLMLVMKHLLKASPLEKTRVLPLLHQLSKPVKLKVMVEPLAVIVLLLRLILLV